MHTPRVLRLMYANVVSLQYKTVADAEEALKKMENEVVPQVRKLAGFRTFHLVRTSETSSIHVGVFDSPEHAEKGRASVYPMMRDLVNIHLETSPRVEHGEVRISA